MFLIKLAPFGRLRTQHSNATKSQSLIVIVLSMPGAGYMDPKVACTAMLDGIEAAVRSMGPTSLTLVRIVFKQRDVQKKFRYNGNVPFFQAKSNGGELPKKSENVTLSGK